MKSILINNNEINRKHNALSLKDVFLLLLLVIMCISFCGCAGDNVEALDTESTDYIVVDIAMGSTGTSISQQLADQGIISDADSFRKYLKKNEFDAKLQAGTYTLSPNMDYDTIADVLVNGLVATKTFTIPEGLTCKQTAQKLADQGIGSYDVFMQEIKYGEFNENDYSFASISFETNDYDRFEGYLLPNTYTVPITYNEHDIIAYLLDQFANYALPVLPDGTTIEELNDIVIKASIIERESKLDDERPLVSSVIKNRLELGMKLEMCSTINYIFLQETGQVKEMLLYSDLEIDSPYNTYMYEGLPKNPICNPSLSSIEAAVNPADTDFLYFVVSSELDGRNKFSSNYKDFNYDVYNYDKAKSASN